MVTMSRATGTLTFPANLVLVAAMNPCPCSYYGDPVKECAFSPSIPTCYHISLGTPWF
jgi:magnesium chelatase family protein